MTDSDAARVSAELEIRNLLARLAHYADSGNTDGYVALLSDDVVWSMPANDKIGLAASERHGRDEIATGQRDRIAAGMQGPGTDTMHVVTTTAIDIDGDTATAHSTFQYWASTSTDPTVTNMGRYDDELRRTPAGWRLSRRRIQFG